MVKCITPPLISFLLLQTLPKSFPILVTVSRRKSYESSNYNCCQDLLSVRKKKTYVREDGCLHLLIVVPGLEWNINSLERKRKEQERLHSDKHKNRMKNGGSRDQKDSELLRRQVLQHLEVESRDIKGVPQSWLWIWKIM